jgi:hypothetical protein
MKRPMHANSFAAAMRQWIDKRTGFLNRRCGPAVEYDTGAKCWWINGRFKARQLGETCHYNGPRQRTIDAFPGYEACP